MRRLGLAALVIGLLGACGKGPASASDGGDAGNANTDGGLSCAPPGVHAAVETVTVGDVSATVLDQTGAAAANTLAQVCGTDICVTAKTDQSGTVGLHPGMTFRNPAFRFGDGLNYGEFAIPLHDGGTLPLGTVRTPKLPSNGTQFSVGSDVVSGPVTLTIAAGGSFAVDTLNYDTVGKEAFRAAEIPVALASVDPSLGLQLVFGTAPLSTVFCPPAKVRVANSRSWAAGSSVEFFILGLDVSEAWAPYATWHKISDGQVSADGQNVETAASGGLPVLSTLGIRPKP